MGWSESVLPGASWWQAAPWQRSGSDCQGKLVGWPGRIWRQGLSQGGLGGIRGADQGGLGDMGLAWEDLDAGDLNGEGYWNND